MLLYSTIITFIYIIYIYICLYIHKISLSHSLVTLILLESWNNKRKNKKFAWAKRVKGLKPEGHHVALSDKATGYLVARVVANITAVISDSTLGFFLLCFQVSQRLFYSLSCARHYYWKESVSFVKLWNCFCNNTSVGK